MILQPTFSPSPRALQLRGKQPRKTHDGTQRQNFKLIGPQLGAAHFCWIFLVPEVVSDRVLPSTGWIAGAPPHSRGIFHEGEHRGTAVPDLLQRIPTMQLRRNRPSANDGRDHLQEMDR